MSLSPEVDISTPQEDSALPPSSNVEEVCKPGNDNVVMMVPTGIHTPKDHAVTCVHVVHQDNTLDIVGDLVKDWVIVMLNHQVY